jgi:hypothetical protein
MDMIKQVCRGSTVFIGPKCVEGERGIMMAKWFHCCH